MRLLIGGGGTGGHLFPAIAVAREWLSRVPEGEVLLVGARRPLDIRILEESGLPHRLIFAGGLKGVSLWQKLRSLLRLGWGGLQALAIFRAFYPDVVLGTGGYASTPVVIASWLFRRPIVLMEPNACPGAANRFLSRMASRIALGLPGGEEYFPPGKPLFTGNPIRREIERLAETNPPGQDAFTLLILGGSQGARAINEAVLQALPSWSKAQPPPRIIHITGEDDLGRLKEAYAKWGIEAEVSSFIRDMANTYRRAHLVLARGGALTVSELAAAGCPAILVPLPSKAGFHQFMNASYLSQGGAAFLIPQKELQGRLAETVLSLGSDPARLQEMARASRSLSKPGASQHIVDLLFSVTRRKSEEPELDRRSG